MIHRHGMVRPKVDVGQLPSGSPTSADLPIQVKEDHLFFRYSAPNHLLPASNGMNVPVTDNLDIQGSSQPLLEDEDDLHLIHQKDNFGGKTIGFWASLFLITNSITGPGLVTISGLFQSAGTRPSFIMLYSCIVTTLGAAMLCEAMRYVPGNFGYKNRIEFAALSKFYYGDKFYYFVQIFLNISLQSVNIASIIETAQVMDLTILKIFGRTGGLEFYPHFTLFWANTPGDATTPFGNIYILSFGILVTLALVIPMGYFNLDDNIIVQIICFTLTALVWLEWFVDFGLMINKHGPRSIPAFGYDPSQVLGATIFNYAFVVTIPSWCNEKKHSVSIYPALWASSITATVVYFLIGVLGAMAFYIPPGAVILDVINSSPEANILSQISVYLFPIVAIASSIPVFSIVIKYNLIENGICGKGWAFFWSAVFPWIVVIPFYTGNGLLNVMNWSSLIFNSVINFVVPLLIFIKALQYKATLPLNTVKLLDSEITGEDEEVDYCCGFFKSGKEPYASTHFALPCLGQHSSLALTGFLVASITILCVGTIIMDIIADVGAN